MCKVTNPSVAVARAYTLLSANDSWRAGHNRGINPAPYAVGKVLVIPGPQAYMEFQAGHAVPVVDSQGTHAWCAVDPHGNMCMTYSLDEAIRHAARLHLRQPELATN